MAPAAPRAALVALVSFAPAAALALGGVPAAPVLLAGQAVLTAGAVAVTTRRDSGASPGAAGGGTGRGGVGERAGDHPPARDPSPASASDEEVARLQAALDALAAHDAAGAGADPARRPDLVDDAAEQAWGFVVLRAALGWHDDQAALDAYRVPGEVRARMGVRRSTAAGTATPGHSLDPPYR